MSDQEKLWASIARKKSFTIEHVISSRLAQLLCNWLQIQPQGCLIRSKVHDLQLSNLSNRSRDVQRPSPILISTQCPPSSRPPKYSWTCACGLVVITSLHHQSPISPISPLLFPVLWKSFIIPVTIESVYLMKDTSRDLSRYSMKPRDFFPRRQVVTTRKPYLPNFQCHLQLYNTIQTKPFIDHQLAQQINTNDP